MSMSVLGATIVNITINAVVGKTVVAAINVIWRGAIGSHHNNARLVIGAPVTPEVANRVDVVPIMAGTITVATAIGIPVVRTTKSNTGGARTPPHHRGRAVHWGTA